MSDHAVDRLRERWPGASSITHHDILKHVASSITMAERHRRTVKAPGGIYVPFDLMGKSGFFVLRGKTVATALEAQQCPEITKYLEEHGEPD